jgi:hypothetical protein
VAGGSVTVRTRRCHGAHAPLSRSHAPLECCVFNTAAVRRSSVLTVRRMTRG